MKGTGAEVDLRIREIRILYPPDAALTVSILSPAIERPEASRF